MNTGIILIAIALTIRHIILMVDQAVEQVVTRRSYNSLPVLFAMHFCFNVGAWMVLLKLL